MPAKGRRGSIRDVNGVTIRPARPADFERLGGLFARAKLGGPSMTGELAFAQGQLGGEAFVADADGELVGASAAVAFGVNGWIGGVAVLPERRGAGLGSALTAAAALWIAEAGAVTASLHATAMGRPVYERLGFAADGRWLRLTITPEGGPAETAHLGVAGPPAEVRSGMAGDSGARAAAPPPGVRPGQAADRDLPAAGPAVEVRPGGARDSDLPTAGPPSGLRADEAGNLGLPGAGSPLGARPDKVSELDSATSGPAVRARVGRAGDLAAALALDRAVTGEDRGRLLRAVWRSGCLVAEEADSRVAGFHAPKPSGGPGGATIARHVGAGAALQAAWRRPGTKASVVLPEANVAGRRALEALGYLVTGATTLMRRGPAPAYRPERVFGGFNLFWG